MTVIADTGFWLALANRNDRYHDASRALLDEIKDRLITTWPVMTETCHLLANRLSVDAQDKFIASATAGAFDIHTLDRSHLPRIQTLMKKYADLPMDLADASLVVLAEESGSGRIVSTDTRDFKTYRWKSRKPFTNLLAEL